MPVLTITPEECGFHARFYAPWAFAPRKGNPAQAYGEPYPDNNWILQKVIELYEYRRRQQYKQADAVRQWLIDYGMIVEMQRNNAVRVLW